jgi:hypothetical protein
VRDQQSPSGRWLLPDWESQHVHARGESGRLQVSHSISNAGPGLAELDATCPRGDTLTGGGAGDGLADAGNSFVVANSPQYGDSTTTWAVIFNLAGAGEDITAIARPLVPVAPAWPGGPVWLKESALAPFSAA